MTKLRWHAAQRAELAELLVDAKLLSSAAVGAATLYHFQAGEEEMVALSTDQEHVVLISLQPLSAPGRRRIDKDVTECQDEADHRQE
ncbi:hypothetical protein [Undibacterium rugosum]|uniref:Uncharacterized protein n=1 Tax=Undibacterium rugosum TaxID=2762291 RepID=A0A923KYQ0_9BURK|nr:hypothetical protein [Undibacterium rugosum]MBC3934668.1 hypothetical protein [Undibacterium rugosum]MBR7779782.1 hypothetical protein [Undibacterium rugosum]